MVPSRRNNIGYVLLDGEARLQCWIHDVVRFDAVTVAKCVAEFVPQYFLDGIRIKCLPLIIAIGAAEPNVDDCLVDS